MDGVFFEADIDGDYVRDPFVFYENLRAAYADFLDAVEEEDGEGEAFERGRRFRIVLVDPSAVVQIQREIVVDVGALADQLGQEPTWGQIWRRLIWPHLQRDSNSAVWREGWAVVVQATAPLRRRGGRPRFASLAQRFRDGEGHCVLTPIRTYLEAKLESSLADATRQRVQRILRRVADFEKWYKDGVPEDALDFVARQLQVRIVLTDPLGGNVRSFNDDHKYGKIFNYRNVRWNHVQEMVCETTVEELSATQMMDQLESLRYTKEFYLLRKTRVGQLPTRIDCANGRFVLDDADRRVFQAARDAYKLDGYAIDAMKEPALARYLDRGCRVTSHARFHAGDLDDSEPEDYRVLDMKQAYTRGADCGAYFQGYVVGISNVRKVEGGIDAVRANPGIYCVKDLDLSGCTERVYDYARQLKVPAGGSMTLPSPELLWWWDHGVRFSVSTGAWGVVLPDIDWSGLGLLEDGTGPLHTGTARYKIWAGQLGYSNNGVKPVWLPGDAQWAAYLASKGYHSFYFDGDNDVCVNLPAASSPSLKHVFAFITAYTRINVLNKLLLFEPQNVRGLMLDAVVFVGDVPDGAEDEGWRLKPDVARACVESYAVDGWYGNTGFWAGDGADDAWIVGTASRVTEPLTFLEGAGGSGKSHSVLADVGFRDVLFAAPTWSLVCFMMRKYGVRGTTVHRLAGEWIDVAEDGTETTTACRPYHEEARRYPAVVFVDEATMVDKRMLERIIATYKGKSQLVIAGDIRVTGIPAAAPPVWFQCRNRTQVFDPRAAACAVVSFDGDFRASGPLVDKKKQLRDCMQAVFLASTAHDPGDDELDARAIAEEARSIFATRVCTAAQCTAEYAKGDTILVGTHELAETWADVLKDKDVRYRVTSHTSRDLERAQAGEAVSLTGDIIDVKGDRAAVFALAFTIHSFQGKTFEGRTLWIDARRMWDYAMLYTAVSRCRTLEQIRVFFE